MVITTNALKHTIMEKYIRELHYMRTELQEMLIRAMSEAEMTENTREELRYRLAKLRCEITDAMADLIEAEQ